MSKHQEFRPSAEMESTKREKPDFRFSKDAEAGLVGILGYFIEKQGERAAKRHIERIIQRIWYLAGGGGFADGSNRNELPPGYFSDTECGHLILCRREENYLLVAQILHPKRDVEEGLKDFLG